MSNFIEIFFRDEDIIEMSMRLGALRRKTPVILTRAANKAVMKARTDIEKETTGKYLTQKNKVRKISRLKRATYGKPTAQLIYEDSFRNLARWSGSPGGNAVRPMKPHQGMNKNPKNYFAHVKKNTSHRPLVGAGPIPFVQIPKNGYKILFRRLGRSRYPIEGVAAPAVPQVVKNEDTLTAVSGTALKVMSKEAQRQLELYLRGKL